LGDKKLTSGGEQISDEFIFKRDVEWVHEADVVVAEVSTPSLGVGYEISLAESLGKLILCLFRPSEGKRLSAMVAGNPYNKVHRYSNIEDVAKILNTYFTKNF
jgi:hypothetical protein